MTQHKIPEPLFLVVHGLLFLKIRSLRVLKPAKQSKIVLYKMFNSSRWVKKDRGTK